MILIQIVATVLFMVQSSVESHFVSNLVKAYRWPYLIKESDVEVIATPHQVTVTVNFGDSTTRDEVEERMEAFDKAINEYRRLLPLLEAYHRAASQEYGEAA